MLKISREFWFTLVSFIFSGLYLFGILKSNDSKEELIEVVTHAVESVILIAGQGVIFYKYMKSRKDAKDREEKGVIDIMEPYEVKPDNSEDTPIIEEELSHERENNERTDNRRSTEVNRRNKKVSKRSKKDRHRRSMESSTAINRSRNPNN